MKHGTPGISNPGVVRPRFDVLNIHKNIHTKKYDTLISFTVSSWFGLVLVDNFLCQSLPSLFCS